MLKCKENQQLLTSDEHKSKHQQVHNLVKNASTDVDHQHVRLNCTMYVKCYATLSNFKKMINLVLSRTASCNFQDIQGAT